MKTRSSEATAFNSDARREAPCFGHIVTVDFVLVQRWRKDAFAYTPEHEPNRDESARRHSSLGETGEYGKSVRAVDFAKWHRRDFDVLA